MTKQYDLIATPKCYVKFDNWIGNPGWTFSNGSPNKVNEYLLMVADGPDKYCLKGTKWSNCFRRIGLNNFENVEESKNFHNGIITWNGDIKWQQVSLTSRLFDPCLPESACEFNVDYLLGKRAKTWWTGDRSRKIVDEIRISKRNRG